MIISHGEAFDWTHDDAIVLREQPALAVYTNPRNEVVIRQACAWDEDDDTVIFVLPENARAVADAILVAAAPLIKRPTAKPSPPPERRSPRDESPATPPLPLLEVRAASITGER